MSDEGNIRFSYRSNEHEVEVVIQGPPSWVNLYRERIGLEGDIGYTQSVISSSSETSDGSTTVKATKESGEVIEFDAVVRLDTPVEVDYYRNGGILQAVLRNLANT